MVCKIFVVCVACSSSHFSVDYLTHTKRPGVSPFDFSRVLRLSLVSSLSTGIIGTLGESRISNVAT